MKTGGPIICDVCEVVILAPVCHNCNYDNWDQFVEPNMVGIYRFIENNLNCGEDALCSALIERYGISLQKAKSLIEEYMVTYA